MPETLTASPETTQVNEQPQAETTISGEHFAPSFFGEDIAKPAQEPPKTNEPLKEEPKPFDEKEWLKTNFEVEDINEVKGWREKIKEFEAKQTKEPEWKNEESKRVYELLREGKVDDAMEIHSKQKQIEKYISEEVNEKTAEGILRLQMKTKYPKLSDAQIEFQLQEDYGVPDKPSRKEDELDEEYNERVAAWESQVQRLSMKKTIAATMAIPDLQKLKTELVYPDISKETIQSKQLTQEDLAAFEKEKTSFLQSSEKMINDFNGFSVQVKDKDVDYTVGYSPSKEERQLAATKFKEFAESGFDANALFAQRWVNEDKTLNVNQMVKDYLRIYADDKANQKLVSDAAAQRLELYFKEKKNININETRQQGTPENKKDESQVLQEKFWGN